MQGNGKGEHTLRWMEQYVSVGKGGAHLERQFRATLWKTLKVSPRQQILLLEDSNPLKTSDQKITRSKLCFKQKMDWSRKD